MKLSLSTLAIFIITFYSSQNKTSDTLKENKINEVTLVGKRPTVENKSDRTVFNVGNSSILAGNTSWEILQMTPLISIDNNDVIKAEGENVTVYINDRKLIFTGKELKQYLQTIPAENLMKIEVITSPSSKYETAGEVVNIVLKKLTNEGIKGNLTVSNQNYIKNSQYSNFNINYHKSNFTQTFTGGYRDDTRFSKKESEYLVYDKNSLTKIFTERTESTKSPSFSSASEIEMNDKNTIGLILEFAQNNINHSSNAFGDNYLSNIFQNSYTQNQNIKGYNRNLGNNFFYKYYDKEKNKILDFNLGFNYSSITDTSEYVNNKNTSESPTGNRIFGNNEIREYYLKADYSQGLGKSEGQLLEFGGKMNFINNSTPYFNRSIFDFDDMISNNFHYSENLNSLYINLSKTFFKKLETRVGLRYEHIYYKIRQNIGGDIEKSNTYGRFLPNLLLRYSFSDNYNLSATYNHNLGRPQYSDLNSFLLPNDDGTFSRGNLDLHPNPSDRFGLKFSFLKKYFISANYSFTNQDFWNTYIVENGNTIFTVNNFYGKSLNYSLYFNTNQTFLKNKLNLNVNAGFIHYDNSDFNKRNNLVGVKDYVTNFNGSTNFSYNNLFNRDININANAIFFMQNNGNTLANKLYVFHTISATKIFKNLGIEATLRLVSPFSILKYDTTTYSAFGSFRNIEQFDSRGASITMVKRFGNQKVKENAKTEVERESRGKK